MKLTILSAILVASLSHCNQAHGECYMRVSTHLTQRIVNSQPTDIQKLVTPDIRGQKCVLQYRVHIGNDWQTAEGIGYGANEAEACSQALDVNRGSLLEEVTATSVQADNQMVCSDIPEIRVHPVRIGDIIWESETDIHTIPAERPYFWYKRSRCRMFVERSARDQNLVMYQGIICRQNSTGPSKWQVIDKY
jgi:hypothetical protein